MEPFPSPQATMNGEKDLPETCKHSAALLIQTILLDCKIEGTDRIQHVAQMIVERLSSTAYRKIALLASTLDQSEFLGLTNWSWRNFVLYAYATTDSDIKEAIPGEKAFMELWKAMAEVSQNDPSLIAVQGFAQDQIHNTKASLADLESDQLEYTVESLEGMQL